MKSVLFGLSFLMPFVSVSQNLHLDQTLYLSGDTIRGTAYFQDARLVPFAYHLSLFDQEGSLVSNQLIWAPERAVPWALPIAEEMNSGDYTLQFSNYQNGIVTQAARIFIVNPEQGVTFDFPEPDGQIGWVNAADQVIDVALFDSTDSSLFTVQVLEEGIGLAPTTIAAGQSSQFTVGASSAIEVNIRSDKFQIYKADGLDADSRLISVESQIREALDLKLSFDAEMAHASLSVVDLGQNPGKHTFPVLPRSYAPACKDLPDHGRVAAGLKSWLSGFQLSGTVKGTTSEVDFSNQRVILANPTDEFDLKYTSTDATGKFGFYNLDFAGNMTLYVSMTGEEHHSRTFEYAPSKSLLIPAFEACPDWYATSDEELAEMIRLRLLGRKVRKHYLAEKEVTRKKKLYTPVELFEDANHTIQLSDYVDFSTMKEVIKEIVPYVFVTKKGIGVFSVDQKKSFQLPPLILINGVPIASNEIIMGLDVADIYSIQVLNKLSTLSPYGNLALGGIVSVVMKDDFDYPPNIERLEMKGYFESPIPTNPTKQEEVPFLPPAIYWNPNVDVEAGGVFDVQTPLPDYDTRLGIEVVGLTTSGILIRKYQVISVSKNLK